MIRWGVRIMRLARSLLLPAPGSGQSVIAALRGSQIP